MLSGKRQLIGPRILSVTLPAGCNHDCVFCITDVHGTGAIAQRPVMSFEQIVRLVEDALDAGTLHIHFSSQGETTLYPKLAELLDRIHRYSRGRAAVQIVTNATHLEKIGIDRILRQKIRLWISLHSADEETWKKIHRPIGESRFAKLQSDLSRILRERPSLATVHSVLCAINFDQVASIVDWAIQSGVRNLFFGRMYKFPELQLSSAQEQQVLSQMSGLEPRLKAAGVKNNLAGYRLVGVAQPAVAPVTPPQKPAPQPSSAYYRTHACYIGWLFSPVSEEGLVRSCGRGRSWGSVSDRSWKEILDENSPGFRAEGVEISKSGGSLAGCACAECPHIQMNAIANHFVAKMRTNCPL